MHRILVFSFLLAILLPACGPTLQRSAASAEAIANERSEQMRLAREIKQKRERRLVNIASRIAPQARTLCKELLGKSTTDCTYKYRLLTNQDLNAMADGQTVYINTGLVRFVESDDELAVIVGHEMAHNMLDHIDKRRGSAIIGAIIDGLFAGATGINTQGAFTHAAANAYSQEYEAEADYLAVYLAERAGYDITVAPDLWRRMGVENPGSIAAKYGATHPSTAERSVELSSAIDEIRMKNLEGLALLPNRLDQDPASPETPEEELIAEEPPPRSNTQIMSLTGRDSIGAGRYVIPEQKPVGQWAFEAEKFATGTGCRNSGGGIPTTELKAQEQFSEAYESACSDGSILSFTCQLGGCRR